jgi:hypothetical protein
MNKFLLEELAEAELLSEKKGKCNGPCERDNVTVTAHLGRDQYMETYKFCFYCAIDYHEYWDGMWSEYHQSVL